MACEFEQADFGPPFAEMDSEVFDVYLNLAIEIFYGACPAKVESQWARCCLSPCTAIKHLTKHLINADPGSGTGSKDVVSERVGDVSVTYSSANSQSPIWGTTMWGGLYADLLRKFEICKNTRRKGPMAVLGRARGCC